MAAPEEFRNMFFCAIMRNTAHCRLLPERFPAQCFTGVDYVPLEKSTPFW